MNLCPYNNAINKTLWMNKLSQRAITYHCQRNSINKTLIKSSRIPANARGYSSNLSISNEMAALQTFKMPLIS